MNDSAIVAELTEAELADLVRRMRSHADLPRDLRDAVILSDVMLSLAYVVGLVGSGVDSGLATALEHGMESVGDAFRARLVYLDSPRGAVLVEHVQEGIVATCRK